MAAAIADPLVEFASNAGWFGAGNFTDHSNLDVVPALFAGVALLRNCIWFDEPARSWPIRAFPNGASRPRCR